MSKRHYTWSPKRALTHIDVCRRILTDTDAYWRIRGKDYFENLLFHVCLVSSIYLLLTQADVCWRILTHMYIHINKYNWPLQPFSQEYGLVLRTTHSVWVNYIRGWRDLQFNVDSIRQIFWETFWWQIYLLLEFLPEIWEQVAEEIFFHFVEDVWPVVWTKVSRLISSHATY